LLLVREAGGDTTFSTKALLALTRLGGSRIALKVGAGLRTIVECEIVNIKSAVAHTLLVGSMRPIIVGGLERVEVDIV